MNPQPPVMERRQIIHVDAVENARRDNSPRRTAQKAGPKKPGPPTLQFINTVHPSDGVTPRSLTLIRSHVAKHGRALQRERKQQTQPVPLLPTQPMTVELRSGPPQIANRGQQQQEDKGPQEHKYEQVVPRPHDQSNRLRLRKNNSNIEPRKLAPKNTTDGTTALAAPNKEEVTLAREWVPNPIQLIGGARGDAHQGFARALSNNEQYLFDFYFDYVIMYGYKACHHKEDDAVFAAAMRTIWVPFAMTEPSLMAAIFHVACRNYASITDNTNTAKFTLQKLQYRQMCLNMAMQAITSQDMASDATISLALLMATEAYFEGDVEAFYAHGKGITKMVKARGGLKSLGLSGFLRKLVGWSLYNPSNYIVLGPEEQE
ncbi:hypothetical protein JDV02_002806 [Purpureocillium takamizusanense]|uniref:Transcription factor domain-containing protein n=1 Tax=Purpureocillium takamizusanense TaxID=2060973 RepID=A0A9Q8V7T7_9HYPO|nr:uncharacterized protein JDV02_002806 [Purpureocillium takamizusanense]UNI16370.1 hypothetical protein JDV02_002806 [Purpureocillium takamizusanense]